MDPSTAPVVIWLQGGPGSSSMYGQFELNGPYAAVKGDGNDDVVAKLNPYTWARVANIVYFDQPVGTGKNLYYLVQC